MNSVSIHLPFFSLLEKSFIKKIRMVSFSGPKMLIVTKSDEVYGLGPLPDSEIHPDNLELRSIQQLDDKGVKKIVFGGNFVLILTEKGEVFSWGDNESGQLGKGSYDQISTPTMIASLGPKKVIDVACGLTHAIVLCNDKQVYFWGKSRSVHPGYMETNAIAITSSAEGAFYINSNGEVYGMGYLCSRTFHSPTYTLGNGYDNAPLTNWTKIASLNKIKKIAGGKYHVIALDHHGNVFVWGDNQRGQLGIQIPSTNQAIPIKLSNFSEKIIDVAANSQSDLTAAMTGSSAIYVWGGYPGGYFSKPRLTCYTSFNEVFTNLSDPNMTYDCVTFGIGTVPIWN